MMGQLQVSDAILRPRVFGAAIIRELSTRVGRKKIGCLAPLSELEMMRERIFRARVATIYDWRVPFWTSVALILIGLAMCRRNRHRLVVE